jgi:hypothetical protein
MKIILNFLKHQQQILKSHLFFYVIKLFPLMLVFLKIIHFL